MNTTAYIFEGKTAAEWKAEAQECRDRSAQSFETCDTDGFLSQWAADTMARRYDHCADIAESGGRIEISAIFDLDGNLLSCDYREGQYGWYFLVKVEGWTGKPFVTTSSASKAKTRAANNAKKGISEGIVSVPAFLDRSHVVQADMDAAKAGDVVIVSTDAHQVRDF